MTGIDKPRVSIINFGMGNLFSIRLACQAADLNASITTSKEDVLSADAVILPGVGAFGDAMDVLRKLDLIAVLKEVAESSKPLMGICLGMQLLMDESSEFGHHEGLGLVRGKVIRFEDHIDSSTRRAKVPQIGWNHIYKVNGENKVKDNWSGTLLEGIKDGEYMYFVHSYYVMPEDKDIEISTSRYGDVKFCSSLQYKNVFACQYHPERSGPEGLKMYSNLRKAIRKSTD